VQSQDPPKEEKRDRDTRTGEEKPQKRNNGNKQTCSSAIAAKVKQTQSAK
jgi:hypothetical protein